MVGTIIAMPLTVFYSKEIPGSRCERIEAAVLAGGRLARGPHEAWIECRPVLGQIPRPDHAPAGVRADGGIRDRRRTGHDRGPRA